MQSSQERLQHFSGTFAAPQHSKRPVQALVEVSKLFCYLKYSYNLEVPQVFCI